MSGTVATPTLKGFATAWEKLYRSAVLSGIVGDVRHRTGYHVGRKYQGSTNYSVVRPQDRKGNGPDDASAAVDMSMSTADMVTCTTRIAAAYENASDPRRKYLNAVNGWLGTGDAKRYDIYARTVKYASADHKWHIHLEWRRAYVLSAVAAKAILSILAGETVAQYLTSIGVTVTERAPAVPAWPGRVFKRGDNSPHIATWQKQMRARGWTSIGPADGDFGPKTERVVRRYQALCKVGVDGAIGKITWPLPWTRPTAK